MNATLHRTITHPPDIEDRQVLHLPAAADLRRLRLTDRLSLRLGLYLLERAQRTTTAEAVAAEQAPRQETHVRPSESYALLTYHLQRQLR